MGKLRELSRELGAYIVYFEKSELGLDLDIELQDDVKGLYLPQLNIIYIREDLTIHEQENVILHELGHCHYGHVHYACHTVQHSSRQEAEANYYMIRYQFRQWILTWDFAPEPEELNINQFMDAYGLSGNMRWLCKKVFMEYDNEFYAVV